MGGVLASPADGSLPVCPEGHRRLTVDRSSSPDARAPCCRHRRLLVVASPPRRCFASHRLVSFVSPRLVSFRLGLSPLAAQGTHGARCTIASPTVQLCSRAPSPRCERHLLHRAAPCTTVQADFPASAPSVREGCTESWHRRCSVSISVACRAYSHIFSCT